MSLNRFHSAADDLWWTYGWHRARVLFDMVAEERYADVRGDVNPNWSRAAVGSGADVLRLLDRRSVRSYRARNLSESDWQHVAEVLSEPPSPGQGAIVVAQGIDGLPAGVYHVSKEGVSCVLSGRLDGKALAAATHGQAWVHGRGALIFLTLRPEAVRDAAAYVDAMVDTGAWAQRVVAAVCRLGLGACMTPAFSESAICDLLRLGDEVEPVYMVKVGIPRGDVVRSRGR